MNFLKWLTICFSVIISIIAITEINSYIRNPESYFLGSEAMVSKGGLYYKNKLIFFLINAIQITLSILMINFYLKAKKSSSYIVPISIILLQIIIIILT
jgi:hypothetical protein